LATIASPELADRNTECMHVVSVTIAIL